MFKISCYEKFYPENVLFNLNCNASKGFYGCEFVLYVAIYDSKSWNNILVIWASDIKQTNKQKKNTNQKIWIFFFYPTFQFEL